MDFPIPPPVVLARDSRYWRISLCNASPLNRNIQLSGSDMCAATRSSSACECISVRDFLRDAPRGRGAGGRGEGRRGGGSLGAFHPSRLCGIQLRARARARTPYTEKLHLEERLRRAGAFPAPSFARLSLIEIQDAPFAQTYAAIFRIESCCNFHGKISFEDEEEETEERGNYNTRVCSLARVTLR